MDEDRYKENCLLQIYTLHKISVESFEWQECLKVLNHSNLPTTNRQIYIIFNNRTNIGKLGCCSTLQQEGSKAFYRKEIEAKSKIQFEEIISLSSVCSHHRLSRLTPSSTPFPSPETENP
uniref:Uncharacterized protein n=1 Tax=Glossina austeni TaxID=7395 RepID=A0A1A9VDR8_GLOAU